MLEWTGERYLPFVDPKISGVEIIISFCIMAAVNIKDGGYENRKLT